MLTDLEAKSENSDSVATDLQKLKDVLQNDPKYYILENIIYHTMYISYTVWQKMLAWT